MLSFIHKTRKTNRTAGRQSGVHGYTSSCRRMCVPRRLACCTCTPTNPASLVPSHLFARGCYTGNTALFMSCYSFLDYT